MQSKKHKQRLLDALYKQYLEKPQGIVRLPGSTTIVFGEGNPDANLMLVGEAPGQQEDEQGRPFVGRSGMLLNKVLDVANMPRDEVFITNIVKTRPPNNRKPTAQEIEASLPLLLDQIKIIRPKLICTLGASSLQGLLGRSVQITKERGKALDFMSTKLLPTYHPAYILRNPKELNTLVQDILSASEIINAANIEQI